MIEPLLLSTARVSIFFGKQPLTGATGFFFERDARLFRVTSRHVLADAPSRHFPNRIEIELHTDARNLTRSAVLSVLLYRNGMSVWHQGQDAGGEIDVAVLEIERALPVRTRPYFARSGSRQSEPYDRPAQTHCHRRRQFRRPDGRDQAAS